VTRAITDAEFQEHFGRLEADGYCVVPDVLDPNELSAARDALERAAAEDRATGVAATYGPGDANHRVWALLNRGDEFVRMALDPVALRFAHAQLGPDVLLSNISANVTGPGGDREIGRLHTDQGFFPEPWAPVVATNVAWFLDDFTEANGATLVVPGSHHVVGYPSHDLEPSAPARITGPAGACAVVDGRLHHATGLNRTSDAKRRGIFALYIHPYLRTQENWTRSLRPEVLAAHPELAAITGFEEWMTLGGVDGPRTSGLNF
jgi:ectoine hydroxylase-related dioxygenase (phytanoyl-CoA dioxygenase family)